MTIIILFYACVYILVSIVYVYTAYTNVYACKGGDQKRTSGVLYYHIPPYSLGQGLSLNLELSGQPSDPNKQCWDYWHAYPWPGSFLFSL